MGRKKKTKKQRMKAELRLPERKKDELKIAGKKEKKEETKKQRMKAERKKERKAS